MNMTMVTFKGKQGEMKGNLVHTRLGVTFEKEIHSHDACGMGLNTLTRVHRYLFP